MAKLIKGVNDLATLRPDIAAEWDYEKNDGITPEQVTAHSERKFWWRCPQVHSYNTRISIRTMGSGCSICSREMKTSFPEQALVYYLQQRYSDVQNGNMDVVGIELDVYIPSISVAIEYDGAKWHSGKKKTDTDKRKNALCSDAGISLIRIREPGLISFDDCICIFRDDTKSFESLNKVILQTLYTIDADYDWDVDIDRDNLVIYSNYLTNLKENSVAKLYPHLLVEWNYEKNHNINPDYVPSQANKRVWWKCSKCGYEWSARPADRINGRGCKICGRAIADKARAKKVLCIELNKVFESGADAARFVNVQTSAISNCCRGKSHMCGGYHWKYVDEEEG